jgi:hypothetical protein
VPRKLRELRADLDQAGFFLDHQTGSHQVWKHALLPGVSANLAGSDGDDAKAYQERQVRLALHRLTEAKQQGDAQ